MTSEAQELATEGSSVLVTGFVSGTGTRAWSHRRPQEHLPSEGAEGGSVVPRNTTSLSASVGGKVALGRHGNFHLGRFGLDWLVLDWFSLDRLSLEIHVERFNMVSHSFVTVERAHTWCRVVILDVRMSGAAGAL